MALLTAGTIIDKVSTILLDTSNVRWTRAELLGWLNEAQKVVVAAKPSASVVTASIRLAAGTKQAIPTAGWLLLDITRNMGTTGATAGAAIRIVTREVLDAFQPTWHSATATDAVENYIFSLNDEETFYVYPPNTGDGYVEMSYSKVPTVITSEGSVIGVSDMYESVLIDYVCYRAHIKDSEYAAGVQLASTFLSSVQMALGLKAQSETTDSPNRNIAPRDPSAKATA
jgi:hypothetical protein